MPNEDLTTTAHRNRAYQALLAVLGDRPIAYHASLAKATKSVTAGILLSQLVYWSQRGKDPEGWIWKTQGEIYEETALGRREQETARRVLVQLKVLEEKRRGVPAKMHFRVDMEVLVNLLSSYQDPQGTVAKAAGSPRLGRAERPRGDSAPGGTRHSSMAESANLVWQNMPDQPVQNRPTIPESTTETTSQNNNTVGVVSDLIGFGMTGAVARHLAASFPEEYIRAKLDLVRWLKENRPRVVGQNPAGYLRKAIQEDYQAPPAYKSARQ
jgi:hypothetical protein